MIKTSIMIIIKMMLTRKESDFMGNAALIEGALN